MPACTGAEPWDVACLGGEEEEEEEEEEVVVVVVEEAEAEAKTEERWLPSRRRRRCRGSGYSSLSSLSSHPSVGWVVGTVAWLCRNYTKW